MSSVEEFRWSERYFTSPPFPWSHKSVQKTARIGIVNGNSWGEKAAKPCPNETKPFELICDNKYTKRTCSLCIDYRVGRMIYYKNVLVNMSMQEIRNYDLALFENIWRHHDVINYSYLDIKIYNNCVLKTLDTFGVVKNQSSHLVYLNIICTK